MQDNVYIKTNRGLKLALLIDRPKVKGTFPGVIILCGFTGYKDEIHLAKLASSLAGNGIACVRFDYRGF